jgi:hypothetical protein
VNAGSPVFVFMSYARASLLTEGFGKAQAEAARFPWRKGAAVCGESSSLIFALAGFIQTARRFFLGSARARAARTPAHYFPEPNQALEPTRTAVTPRADARVAPSVRVAHL